MTCIGTYSEVFVWDVSASVLNLQVVKGSLQCGRLVQHLNGNVKTSQDTFAMSLELARRRVVASNTGEQ
jgi:hypothetical protein